MRYFSTLLLALLLSVRGSDEADVANEQVCKDESGTCGPYSLMQKDVQAKLRDTEVTLKKTEMRFEHRNGEVQLTFTENTVNEADETCVLKGGLVDDDAEAGSLDITFELGWLDYHITDTSSGEMIFSQTIAGMGTENAQKFIGVEGDVFTEVSDAEGDSDSEGDASLSEVPPKPPKSVAYVGKVSMRDSTQLLSLRSHAIHRHRTDASSSQEKFSADIDALLADKRDNAIVELAVALGNAGVTAGTHPCAYDLLMLSQNLAGKSTSLSSHTSSDVEHLQNGDMALLQVRNMGLSKVGGASNETLLSCNGCSNTCGNTCFGRCGNGCSNWWWVCGSSNAYQGCCEHDGFCSCGGMHWMWCWGFYGDCWTPMCAASRCESCDSCSGTTRRRQMGRCSGVRRRRRGGWR